AAIEFAERAVTERVVQLAEQAPVRCHLNLEGVAEQPRGPLGTRRVDLFRVVPTILDPAGELHRVPAVAQTDPGRLAIGLRVGLRIVQRADLRAGAEIPALSFHEVDSGGVRETGQRVTVMVALLDVDAGTVGESLL